MVAKLYSAIFQFSFKILDHDAFVFASEHLSL
jgi:hypothetical protein